MINDTAKNKELVKFFALQTSNFYIRSKSRRKTKYLEFSANFTMFDPEDTWNCYFW